MIAKAKKSISFIIIFTLAILLIPITECKVWADDNSQITGNFGRQITYQYDQTTYTLTISGKGELYNSGSIVFDDEIRSVKHIRFENYSASTIPLFKELYDLEDIVIPDSVTSFFPNDEFNCCYNLQNVELPDGIEYLGSCAFQSCTSLKTIEIPDSVQYLPNTLFNGCTSLENVVLPEGPTELNCWFFGNCSSLKSVTLPSTIKTVSDNVFHGCVGLESISFPNGVEKILHQNFDGCTNLKEVLIPASTIEIDSDNFDYLDNFVIVGAKGSYAEEFSNNNGIPFVIHEHKTFSEETITKEPTCTEEGSKEKICSVCGDKVTETIQAKGHSWNDDYTVDIEASCKEEGSKSIHCSVCGAKDESTVTVIPKGDHTYGDWKVMKEATCTEDGSKEKVCSVCGDKVTETIAAKGHTWDKEYTIDKAATCTEEGLKSIHCSICGVMDESTVTAINATDHVWNSVEYTWSEDNLSVTATRICKYNSSHKETETVKTTSEITKAATYTAKGQTKYIAVFENTAFTTQSKVVANIPVLAKKAQPMTVKATAKTVKVKKLKKKAQTVSPLTVKNAQGTVTYKLVGGNAKSKKALKLNTKTGKITVKKGTKKGTYKINVIVTATGTTEYKAGSKTVMITVKAK